MASLTGSKVIFGIIVWFVSSFGIKYFNMFERYAYIPQVCVLFSLIGCAAPYFDTTTKSTATGSALSGARLSYIFVCASGPLGWSPFVADFFVYHPKSSNRWLVFAMTLLGFVASKIFVEFIGIGWLNACLASY
jgi:purine-cytosine permease-like protein